MVFNPAREHGSSHTLPCKSKSSSKAFRNFFNKAGIDYKSSFVKTKTWKNPHVVRNSKKLSTGKVKMCIFVCLFLSWSIYFPLIFKNGINIFRLMFVWRFCVSLFIQFEILEFLGQTKIPFWRNTGFISLYYHDIFFSPGTHRCMARTGFCRNFTQRAEPVLGSCQVLASHHSASDPHCSLTGTEKNGQVFQQLISFWMSGSSFLGWPLVPLELGWLLVLLHRRGRSSGEKGQWQEPALALPAVRSMRQNSRGALTSVPSISCF